MGYKEYIQSLNESSQSGTDTGWIDTEGNAILIGDLLELVRKADKQIVYAENVDDNKGLLVLYKDKIGRFMANSSEAVWLNKNYFEQGKFELYRVTNKR